MKFWDPPSVANVLGANTKSETVRLKIVSTENGSRIRIVTTFSITPLLDRCFSLADNASKVIEQNLKQSERLRQSILKTAFEGKLLPEDSSQESASILLQRIKEEKARIEIRRPSNKRRKIQIHSKQNKLF